MVGKRGIYTNFSSRRVANFQWEGMSCHREFARQHTESIRSSRREQKSRGPKRRWGVGGSMPWPPGGSSSVTALLLWCRDGRMVHGTSLSPVGHALYSLVSNRFCSGLVNRDRLIASALPRHRRPPPRRSVRAASTWVVSSASQPAAVVACTHLWVEYGESNASMTKIFF